MSRPVSRLTLEWMPWNDLDNLFPHASCPGYVSALCGSASVPRCPSRWRPRAEKAQKGRQPGFVFLSWSIVDLQCCVSFRYTAKWFGYTYTHISISIIFQILSPYQLVQSVQSLSCVRLFAIPWIAARQASLSITNSRSSLRLVSIESVMLSSHLILCRPLLLPPIPPSIRVFSNESTLCMRWPKYWSFSYYKILSIVPCAI